MSSHISRVVSKPSFHVPKANGKVEVECDDVVIPKVVVQLRYM